MVRFALVTLVHNKEKFLRKCLNSAKNQMTKKFMHIIINDGSKDGSDQIIEEYKKDNPNVIYYKFDDRAGQMPRYNYALRKINKLYNNIKYMGHLDADDMLIPDAIKNSMIYFETALNSNGNIGHVSSNFSIIDRKDNVIHKRGRVFLRQKDRIGWKRAQLANNLFGHFRTMRIDCLNAIGGFDEQFEYATDFNMACHMMDRFDVDINEAILYLWRRHGDQIEGTVGAKQTECWRQIQKYYKKRWKL